MYFQIFKYIHLLELRCVTMCRHGCTAKDLQCCLPLWALSEKKLHHPTSVSFAALTFASPGLLRRYLRAESNGTPGPPLGS